MTRAPGAGLRIMPRLEVAVTAITLLFCLFLFEGTQKLFRDSDTGWHIRNGEAILDGRGLPFADPYSLLKNGQPWFAWEWLADLAMGGAHRADGLTGVVMLYAALLALCTWLWFRVTWAGGGSFLVAAAFSILMLSTANLHWLARPHVFSWVLLLATLWACETRKLHWALFAAIGLVWANVHASFFLGIAICGAYAIGSLLRPLIWDLERGNEWREYGIAAGMLFATSFINPYGWKLHVHVLSYLRDSELIDRIGEFQSFNFHAEGAVQILLTVALGFAGGVIALGQRKLAHGFLCLGFTALALRSARGLPLVALVVLPLVNGAMTEALGRMRGLRIPVRRAVEGFLEYSANLRKLDLRVNGLATLAGVVVLCGLYLQLPAVKARTGFPPDEFPVQAADVVERLPVESRILAPDKFGGYLIYRFQGSRKVYFDGRSDFYGARYMKDYLRLIEVREGWQRQMAEARFTHALLPNRYSLIPALEQIGWRKIYSDATATLLERGKQ